MTYSPLKELKILFRKCNCLRHRTLSVGTCCGWSWPSVGCFPGADDVAGLRYSLHHRVINCSMVCEELSSLWLLEFQGFTAPRKWTIFASWPNLQEPKSSGIVNFGANLFWFPLRYIKHAPINYIQSWWKDLAAVSANWGKDLSWCLCIINLQRQEENRDRLVEKTQLEVWDQSEDELLQLTSTVSPPAVWIKHRNCVNDARWKFTLCSVWTLVKYPSDCESANQTKPNRAPQPRV